MRQYLAANPEYSQYDYPSFEEFDKNGYANLSSRAMIIIVLDVSSHGLKNNHLLCRDGYVNFNEWRRYIEEAEQAAAAQEQLYYQQVQQQQQKKGVARGRK